MQLNVFIERVIIREPVHDDIKRAVMNFANHTRPNQRTRVARTQTARDLRRKLVTPRARYISPKGAAILGRAKIKPMIVPREVFGERVTRKKVNFFPKRTQGKG